MLVVLLATLQATAGPPAPVPEKLRTARPCPVGAAERDDVVVRARGDLDYRLKPLRDIPDRKSVV